MARVKVFGNIVNSVVNTILKSPLHALMSEHSLAVRYMGRESGKEASFPAYYYQSGNSFYILVEKSEEWWRSLRGGANVKVTIKGDDHHGWAESVQDLSELTELLSKLLGTVPELLTELDVRKNALGSLDAEDLQKILQQYSFIKIDLQVDQT